MQHLLHDCQLAFTARTKDESSAYSSGCTFFIPASMKPRCALERLALDIFQAHVKDLDPDKHYDLERSGAEWWTLVLDTSSKSRHDRDKDNNGDDNDDDDDDDEVGMHFDADYGLEHQLPHYMVHPRVATVTYLSNVGVPTLVLNRKSPPPTDVEKTSLNGPVDKAWLSYPMVGKHIAFDGRLLHGAPGTFFPTMWEDASTTINEKDVKKRRLNDNVVEESSKTETDSRVSKCPQRITFLVNVWLNHCPMDAELLDDDLCGQMKTPWNGGGGKKNAYENEKLDRHLDGLKDDQETLNPTKKRDATEASDNVTHPTDTFPWLWNLHNVSHPPKLPKAVVQPAKSLKQAAGTDECVICGREVDIHYQSEMNVLHKVSNDAYQVEGKSMEIDFDSNSVALVVGPIVEDSDDSEEEGGDE
jgi:hypothetical protein